MVPACAPLSMTSGTTRRSRPTNSPALVIHLVLIHLSSRRPTGAPHNRGRTVPNVVTVPVRDWSDVGRVSKKDKVIIVDDLIATGGTALASAKIVEKCKAKVSAFLFLIDLFDLPGNNKLLSKGYKTFKLIDFPGH